MSLSEASQNEAFHEIMNYAYPSMIIVIRVKATLMRVAGVPTMPVGGPLDTDNEY